MASSPLFRRAGRAIREAAQREFRSSDFGRLYSEVERLTRTGPTSSYMDRLRSRVDRLGRRGVLQKLSRRRYSGGLQQQIERYAKGDQDWSLLNQVFRALGPLGGLLKALLRPTGKRLTSNIEREMSAATKLLESFGYEVIPPPGKRAGLEGKARGAQQFLESLGFQVTPPGKGPTPAGKPGKKPIQLAGEEQPAYGPFIPPGKFIPPTGKRRAGQVEIRTDSGRRRFKPNDPVVTGEMIPVTSSNVHSIGFDIDPQTTEIGTLKIRFLQRAKGDKGRAGVKTGGPLYCYSNVPTDLFVAFTKAASKGKFVWDKIRIRGTVSGHRFDYRLVGITAGYVPRKATFVGDSEWYLQRRVKGPDGRLYVSGPDMLARRVGSPNRGRPDNGGPNRGRPNRGRP